MVSSLIITLVFLIVLSLVYLLFIKLRKSQMSLIPKNTANGSIDSTKVSLIMISETNIILIIDGHAIQFPNTSDLFDLVYKSSNIPKQKIKNINPIEFIDVGNNKFLVCMKEYNDSMLIGSADWNIENAEQEISEINNKIELTTKSTSTFKKIF